MRFLVDATAGRLAKWLRILGFDAEYVREGTPMDLVRRAQKEERILLSRNMRFKTFEGEVPLFLLRSEKPFLQLREVFQHFKLKDVLLPFTRCSSCNRELRPVSLENVRSRVPFFVLRTEENFSECPVCLRVYWPGTHRRAMEEVLEELTQGIP